jgi:1A family penicillin-binding protein
MLVGLFSWLIRTVFRLVWWVFLRATIIGILVLAVATGYYYTGLPPASEQVDGRARGSVTMLDRYNKVFAWRGQQFGGISRIKDISPYLVHAVVATEDKRFYQHFGVSPRGIASAIVINLRDGRGPLQGHGGSTLTQQVAKIVCLGKRYDPKSGQTERQYEAGCRQATVWRKLNEVPYALAMELKYTKDQILMIYMNRAFLGAGAQGFEAASRRYFGKSAGEVTPAESALLAGLLVAPSYYAPTRNLARANDRARVILGLMEAQGYLTKAEADYARAHPAKLSPAAQARAGGYFADWVMATAPSFLTKATTEDVVIKTTFDPEVQKAAEAAFADVFKNKVSKGSKAQAAMVVMSADGAVRAMVGGRALDVAGQFNRATQALRQTGSSFKPFVYGAALDLGYRFDTIVEDAPITIDIPGSGPWSPKNYSGKFMGPVTITKALAYSLNTVAVRVSEDVGRDAVRAVAKGFGIRSKLADGPALALGASESTVLEMTGAYAGILNGGTSVRPYGLVEISLQGDKTPLMGKSGGLGERVITEDSARQLVYMMNQVSLIGSGRRAQLPDRQIGAKTGTTQGARDAWFIGYTANYVAGVWMGYDDNSKLTGVTGGGLPAQIWKETMLAVTKGTPARALPMIDPVLEASPNAVVKGAARRKDPTRTIIEDVLGAIFGRPRSQTN